MTDQGVILYGPPTSGKDTITGELAELDERFALVPKLKAGTGRSTGYRIVTAAELEALRGMGRLAVETSRYGNIYAVDRHDIEAMTKTGRVPVVHMGNVADLRRLRSSVSLNWTCVLLWISREVCAERSRGRGDADRPERLRAWDETRADLAAHQDAAIFNLVIHTDATEPAKAARLIIDAVDEGDHRALPLSSLDHSSPASRAIT
ncbi:guanylate kinase [Thermomonospora catenispora]|mgnify:CR=1 FL=1|uniref:guanylate kinase n=1 Tax=Thermomonospora catenispora TaxID=2493090 RepID=UPI00111F85E2|nr:guanylate kinase [Thermomonospora catenispora]TNY38084.1 guanylate kinase [Thermomonospora catenispora]